MAESAEKAPQGTEERRFAISGDGAMSVRAPGGRLQWSFKALPDRPPAIALAKDPEARYPSAGGLGRAALAAATAVKPSLVRVLV